MIKIHTIWKHALVFDHGKIELERKVPCENLLYLGAIDEMPYEIADKVAAIHPNFRKHFDGRGSVWYKGYGYLSGGTEDPIAALKSLRTKGEIAKKKDCVIIWKI